MDGRVEGTVCCVLIKYANYSSFTLGPVQCVVVEYILDLGKFPLP